MVAELARMRTRRNWEEVGRFTPELYAEYSSAPIWEIDSPQFNGYRDYESYWTNTIKDLVQSSRAVIGKWQQAGRESARNLETDPVPQSIIFNPQDVVSQDPLPLAISQIHEKVALLSANPPKFMIQRQQEGQQQYASALDQFMGMVLAANKYHSKITKGLYTIQFWNACAFKWTIDFFEPGIFGEPGKVSLSIPDMENLFPDPNAKELDVDCLDYIIEKHSMEIGEIQYQYPFAANRVQPDRDENISDTGITAVSSRNNEDYIQSPQPKLARDQAGRQQKITVYECYLRDSRTKFEPRIVKGDSPDYDKRFKQGKMVKLDEGRYAETDSEGYIIGDWVKRYPDGRLFIVTSEIVLKDCANPYPHGKFPYVFAHGMPASTPWASGNAKKIMSVTRKINRQLSDVDRFYCSETPRPMTMSSGAILDPNLSNEVPNNVAYIIEMAPGGILERRQATDVPPGVWTYVQLLKTILDMTSGSSGLMRGQLEEGDQLSAEAVNNLQQFASSRLALEAALFNEAIIELGYQLMWILRAIVKNTIKVMVEMPDGKKETIDWTSDREVFERGDPIEIRTLRAREDYLVTIKAGTGAPGAQAAQQSNAQSLFNDKAIDRQAYLDQIQYPGRNDIVQRMEQKELQDMQNKAFGKAMGVSVGDAIKQEEPGRREKI